MLRILNAKGVEVQGFTVTSGRANGSSNLDDNKGGGILCHASDVRIENCRIINNYASYRGGIAVIDGQVTLRDNFIRNNSASYYAGVGLSGGNHLIEGNTIEYNTAGADGGGVYLAYADAQVSDNVVTDNDAGDEGGGMYLIGLQPGSQVTDNEIMDNSAACGAGAFLTSSQCTFSGGLVSSNSAENKGGGLYFSSCNTPVSDTSIESNTASVGGGVYVVDSSSMSIQHCTVSYNYASDTGGGCVLRSGLSTINDSWFEGNETGLEGEGGAVVVVAGLVDIMGNVFTENSASRAGAIDARSGGDIVDNIIFYNEASEGAGIACRGLIGTVHNNLIASNWADGPGGGILVTEGSTVAISNNTIVSNTATNGGGIRAESGCDPSIFDCIVWGNGDDFENCSVTYCCSTESAFGMGNITDDPKFTSGPLGSFYLSSDSPCIDAGSRTAYDAGMVGMTTQADNTPDIDSVDMGYHHTIE